MKEQDYKEQRYRELFDYELDGVLSLDLDGRITVASESGRGLLGYETEDLLGRPFAGFIAPQDSESRDELW